MRKIPWTFLQLLFLIAFIMTSMVACGPPEVLPYETIKANETAFLVPLTGNSKAQKGFMSEQYLNANKVATKRVTIPVEKRKNGRFWFEYEWLPTMKVIVVNRSPETREWTESSNKGTSSRNEAIVVESRDSIAFGVGVNISAHITEEDAAKFLYTFAGKPLATIMDSNVRGMVTSILSNEFAKYDLEIARSKKGEILAKMTEKLTTHFKTMGITITNVGFAEGLKYENPQIQDSIDAKFKAEMDIQIAAQETLAQEKRNEKNVAMATAEALAAKEFAKAAAEREKQVNIDISRMNAEANLERARKWDGKLPNQIIPSDMAQVYMHGAE